MQIENDSRKSLHKELEVGDILRRARLRKKISLDDIELAIRISKPHLVAIEEGRLESLPGRIYAQGFIRSYADYLGLNGEKILQLLRKQSGARIGPNRHAAVEEEIIEDHSIPSLRTWLMVSAALVIASSFTNDFTKQQGHYLQMIPPVPKDLKDQVTLLTKPEISFDGVQVENKPKDTNTTAEQTPTPAPVVHPVILKAVETVWLEIRNDEGKPVFSRVIQAGEKFWVPQDQKGLTMTLGNAGGLKIVLNDKELPFLGATGQVIKGIPLDPEKLELRLKSSLKDPM